MLVRVSIERFRICQGRFPQEYLLVFQGVLTQADVKLGGADVGKVLISASLAWGWKRSSLQLFGIKKKEDEFYVLLREFSAKIVVVSEALQNLVNDYTDVEEKATGLKLLETECDVLTHNILTALNGAFVTPLDREDIYEITKGLDEIVDLMEEVGSRFLIFDVKVMRPETKVVASIIVQCVKELDTLFRHLHEIKTNNISREQVIEINRLENEGDVFFRSTIHDLFINEKNPIELVKWKHLYEQLEACLDACENVANTIEGVVVKYA
jgi:predicted phosphate transport protein (TIGR00153 family)